MIDTVAVRQDHVGDQHVRRATRKDTVEPRQRLDRRHLVPSPPQGLTDDGTDRGVVIDDEDMTHDWGLMDGLSWVGSG
ncbi:hypothetical protein GCM10020258_42570 [Sphingomonas yabuuchiae]